MNQNPWKSGHPGVPREWQKIGEGGNAVVWRDEGHAIKRLKPTAGREARERFKRECELMAALKGEADLKIIPVIEVRQREEADEIVMDLLDNSLESVIERFQCQPIKAAAALVGVVDTLAKLAAREPRLHHRDIKPTNLLYRATEDDLYIGDFGCAYLAGSDRITPDWRALGAWAYRPPEYSGGRVEDVDERGDVFSLGKLLWSMINGNPSATFPGPVWFLPEYDLTVICGEAQRTAEAMYVIAKCCSIVPDKRPSLSQLKTMLESMAADNDLPGASLGASALKREQEQEIAYQQRHAVARPFVLRLTEDLEQTLVQLQRSNPSSARFNAWLAEWKRINDRSTSLVEQVAINESDAPVLNVHRRQEELFTRFYPDGMNGPLRFYAAFGKMHQQHLSPRLTVEARDTGPVALVEGLADLPEIKDYTATTIIEFFMRAIEAFSENSA